MEIIVQHLTFRSGAHHRHSGNLHRGDNPTGGFGFAMTCVPFSRSSICVTPATTVRSCTDHRMAWRENLWI